MSHAVSVCAIALSSALAWKGFTPPDAPTRLGAIGDLSEEPADLKRAFDPTGFEPIAVPGSSDWLAQHEEPGETFLEFKSAKRNVPAGKRRKIYFQPLGDFARDKSPSLDALKDFAAAYFGVEVIVLPTEKLEEKAFSPRENEFSRNRQILTTDVMEWLKKKLPDDAFCVLAITMTDLYPDPKWNFVFGQASIRGRVGVYSFARYDPQFYGKQRGKDFAKLILLRSMKVLAHETGHMFGIAHCIFFQCCMNGSNNLEESDAQPLHLCPICLRKLHASARFDVAARYRKLGETYKLLGLEAESKWVNQRADRVEGDKKSGAAGR